MSELHPIIAITGSSGAGTTSVTRTFSNMFRRESVNAAIVEGDSFHRYDRKSMREAVAKADARSALALQPLRPRGEPVRGSGAPVRRLCRDRPRQAPQVSARRGRSRAVPAGARHVHAHGRTCRRYRSAVLRRPARRRRARQGQYRQAPRSADRRRAGHQPRMDPEAAPRQLHARLLDRSGDGYDAAPHARLRALHLPAVLAHARELAARADRRHVEPVHRARHSERRRKLRRDPLPRSERHRLPLSPFDAARLVHVAREHDRRAGRQDGARDARSSSRRSSGASSNARRRPKRARRIWRPSHERRHPDPARGAPSAHAGTAQRRCRAARERDSPARRRRRRESQIRPSRHADGHGRDRGRALDAASSPQSARSGMARSRSLRDLERARLDAAVRAAAPDRLRPADRPS